MRLQFPNNHFLKLISNKIKLLQTHHVLYIYIIFFLNAQTQRVSGGWRVDALFTAAIECSTSDVDEKMIYGRGELEGTAGSSETLFQLLRQGLVAS